MNEAADEQSVPQKFLTSCGTYSWDVRRNNIQLDATLAGFFRMTPEQAEHGITLDTYLEAVHADDRACVAAHINLAVTTGQPCRQSYRLLPKTGEPLAIVAMVSAFATQTVNPRSSPG